MKYREYMTPEGEYSIRIGLSVIVMLYMVFVCSIPAKLLIMWLRWLF